MQDFGSSAEDSQVSQSEPELRGNKFVTTHVVRDEISTDDDDKFCPLQELAIPAPPTLPQNPVPSVPQTTPEDWENLFQEGSFPQRQTF